MTSTLLVSTPPMRHQSLIRRSLRPAAALSLTLALGACLITADPVITEADATFDGRLLGTWEEVGGSDRATVTRGTGDRYVIEYADKQGVARYEARLGTLGGRLVLDLWPEPRRGEIPKQYTDMLLPVHLALALTITQDEVRFSLLAADAMVKSLGDGASPIAHSRAGHRTVLHGTTAELRTAFAAHLARGDALESPAAFRRAAAR